jgi:hypothetical protein
LALAGCATIPVDNVSGPLPTAAPDASQRPQSPVFRASLRIRADGQEFVGTASLKRISMGRKISFEVPRGTYQLAITNCAGELLISNPSVEWFDWTFVPIYGIENLGSCIVMATALTSAGEIHKAIVDFNDGQDLPATVWCNRDKLTLSGAALCQSRAEYGKPGLTQRVDFVEPTVWVAQPGCPEPRKAWISTDYEIDIGPGFCVYKFEDSKRRKFRLTTYGYTEIRHVVPEVSR